MGVTRVRSRVLGGGARVRPAFSHSRNIASAQGQFALTSYLEVKPDAKRAEVRSLSDDLSRHYGMSHAVR